MAVGLAKAGAFDLHFFGCQRAFPPVNKAGERQVGQFCHAFFKLTGAGPQLIPLPPKLCSAVIIPFDSNISPDYYSLKLFFEIAPLMD